MPTTITLKNIPDDVYKRLRESAAMNKRSLNNEAIVCLENALMPDHLPPAQRLERIRALRASLPKGKFKASEIDALKRAANRILNGQRLFCGAVNSGTCSAATCAPGA